jgi:putative transposase
VARLPLFEKPADYAAFLRVLDEALAQGPMHVLAFVLMPNPWHFLLWPEEEQGPARFFIPGS